MPTEPETRAQWWAQRRWPYNRALIIAGILALGLYVATVERRCSDAPDAEITLFTTAFQGIAYLLAIVLANVCFNLGSWTEAHIQPRNPSQYRNLTYRLGFWFSVALPFSIPAIIWWRGCAGGAT
jgi:hypothetical protein